MKIKSLIFSFCMGVLVLGVAHAQSVSNETIENAVKDVAGKSKSASVVIQQATDVVPKYNEDQGTDYYGDGMVIPTQQGSQKTVDCSTLTPKSNLYDRQECEGVNFVAKNRSTRPNMTVTTHDPVISGNRDIASSPEPTLTKYGWTIPKNADGSVGTTPTTACSPTTLSIAAQYDERHCSTYKGSEIFLCKQLLKVTVVPHFNYQCNDTLSTKSTEKCSKILQVKCVAGGEDCAQSGIDTKSYDSDMTTSFTSIGSGLYKINFGVYQDNYWSGPRSINQSNRGSIYYRKLSVQITGKDRLARFTLDKVHEDDYALIKINGVVAFATSPIEDRIENADKVVTYSFRPCKDCQTQTETTNAHLIQVGPDKYLPYGTFGANVNTNVERAPSMDAMAYPNFNAKPYLVDGTNTIEVWTLVGDKGEFYSEWTTQMYCPASCTDTWNSQCDSLELRAK